MSPRVSRGRELAGERHSAGRDMASGVVRERHYDAGADCLIQQHREGGITLTNPEPQSCVKQDGPSEIGRPMLCLQQYRSR
jgi:hypothetical protein